MESLRDNAQLCAEGARERTARVRTAATGERKSGAAPAQEAACSWFSPNEKSDEEDSGGNQCRHIRDQHRRSELLTESCLIGMTTLLIVAAEEIPIPAESIEQCAVVQPVGRPKSSHRDGNSRRTLLRNRHWYQDATQSMMKKTANDAQNGCMPLTPHYSDESPMATASSSSLLRWRTW